MQEQIGFIGLGIMGRGMAANILRAGYPLTVWNRTAARMDDLLKMGATAAATPAALAAQCDIIITCVSDTPDVTAVVLGDNGVVHGIQPGRAAH
jgi:3-hydroxyisobutyrate dehydrogenase